MTDFKEWIDYFFKKLILKDNEILFWGRDRWVTYRRVPRGSRPGYPDIEWVDVKILEMEKND